MKKKEIQDGGKDGFYNFQEETILTFSFVEFQSNSQSRDIMIQNETIAFYKIVTVLKYW